MGQARIAGRLFQVPGGYPGLVLAPKQLETSVEQVVGDLYRITDMRLIALLDEYEGCARQSPRPHEYHREQWVVWPDQSTSNAEVAIKAWVYIYQGNVRRCRPIPSGNFLQQRFNRS